PAGGLCDSAGTHQTAAGAGLSGRRSGESAAGPAAQRAAGCGGAGGAGGDYQLWPVVQYDSCRLVDDADWTGDTAGGSRCADFDRTSTAAGSGTPGGGTGVICHPLVG